jgi:hypothetical protein
MPVAEHGNQQRKVTSVFFRSSSAVSEDPIFTQLRMWDSMRAVRHPILTISTRTNVYEGHLAGLVVRDCGAVVHLNEGNLHHVIRVSQIETITEIRRTRDDD